MQPTSFDDLHPLERIVCLVDGSRESLESLGQAQALAFPLSRIVAVIPLDMQAAARTRCQAGEVASAWDSQAKLIRTRATKILAGSWGYTRIVEGSVVSALVKAQHEEEGTMVAAPAAALKRGGLRKLLRQTHGSLLVTRAPIAASDATLLLIEADDVKAVGADLANRLRLSVRVMAGPRTTAATAAAQESRRGDLVVLRGDIRGRRWLRPLEETVATRAAGSVLIIRGSPDGTVMTYGRSGD